MITPRIDRLDQNYFINAGMDWYQRANGNIPVQASHVCRAHDRWLVYSDIAGCVVGPYASQLLHPKTKRSMGITCTPTNISQIIGVSQIVESIFAVEFNGEPISLSCYVRSQSASRVRLQVLIPNAEDNYASYTSYTIGTKDITTDNNINYVKFENINIPQSTVNGAWFYIQLENFTVLNSSVVHFIGAAKLNIGKTCQDFSLFGGNRINDFKGCLRYFERRTNIFGETLADGLLNRLKVFNTGFFEPKRAAPLLVVYGGNNFATVSVVHQYSQVATTIGVSTFYASSVTNTNGFIQLASNAVAAQTYEFGYTADAEI